MIKLFNFWNKKPKVYPPITIIAAKADPMLAVKKMIKRHEGLRLKRYKDSLGYWTIGYGHLMVEGENIGNTITLEQANEIFEEDFKHHAAAAKNIPGYDQASDEVKGALIDLTFNMGPVWYKKWPSFSKAMAEGNYEQAAIQLERSKWFTQVGNRAPAVVAMIRSGSSGDIA